MLNKKILGTAMCVTALVAGTYSATSSAVSLNPNATAVVVFPLTLVDTVSMDFGTVSGAGNVTIAPASAVATVSGTATATAVTPAQFTVTAETGVAYTVGFTGGTMSDGVDTIAVGTFTNNATGTGTGAAEIFEVGATITLAGTEGSGSYSTADPTLGVPYTITVNY